MPFGLVNAPATFQAMINHIFRDMLDQGTLAFMDDIIIHAVEKEDHDKIGLEVLHRLQENGLCIAPNKCEWAKQEVEFLGYIISGQEVRMTDDKIATIKEIEPVASLKEVQHFMGFANFYKRFIKDYSTICLPLTDSTALNPAEWRQTPEILRARETLIKAFTTAPVLRHFDPEIQTIVETDASDFALGAILSQKQDSGTRSTSGKQLPDCKDSEQEPPRTNLRLHPIAFHSRKFTSAEANYETCDKELLAIVGIFIP